MTRVHVACEGPTELTFVREVLAPALPRLSLLPFYPGKYPPRGTTRPPHLGKGQPGDVRYARLFPDVCLLLRDPGCHCTTLLDYYALGADFPKSVEPAGAGPHEKAQRIEWAVQRDIATRMGKDFNTARFRCFLAMHEFEGLLFSAQDRLASALGRPDLREALAAVRRGFSTPEHINDDRATAPSRRLAAACPGYDKVIGGNVAALEVGLEAMRRECPHFHAWLEWLEGLA